MNTNINIKISNFSSLLGSLQRSIGYILWALFLVVLIWDIIIAKNSVSIVLSKPEIDDFPKHNPQAVRINFTDYNKAVKRIEDSSVFEPEEQPLYNPFQPPPQ